MDFLRNYQLEILLGLAALVIIQLVVILSLNGRVARTSRLLRQLLTGPTGEDLEAQLNRCLEESRQALQRSDELQNQLTRQDAMLQSCVQKIGLVRFDEDGVTAPDGTAGVTGRDTSTSRRSTKARARRRY